MDIIYAAEKPSIAALLSTFTRHVVSPEDIDVTENPAETGSFFIGGRFGRYVLAPNGEIAADVPGLVD